MFASIVKVFWSASDFKQQMYIEQTKFSGKRNCVYSECDRVASLFFFNVFLFDVNE